MANESRSNSAALQRLFIKLDAAERQLLRKKKGGIERSPSGAPRQFQGALDVGAILGRPGPFSDVDIAELEAKIGGPTLFTRSLRRKELPILQAMLAGTAEQHDAALAAIREMHERVVGEQGGDDIQAEAVIGTSKGYVHFED